MAIYLSEKRTDLMFLKANAVQKMRYFEVCIPPHGSLDPVVDMLFRATKQALEKLSSNPLSSVHTPPNSSLNVDSHSTRAPIDTRRVQGADFGLDFMTLPVDEKMTAINQKIRAHVKDEQQLMDCMEMIREFERAVELDNAAGSLGNGHVTWQICRMVKEEVPHEMLDLFLMMARLRLQQNKEGVKKKRKWDVTGF